MLWLWPIFVVLQLVLQVRFQMAQGNTFRHPSIKIPETDYRN